MTFSCHLSKYFFLSAKRTVPNSPEDGSVANAEREKRENEVDEGQRERVVTAPPPGRRARGGDHDTGAVGHSVGQVDAAHDVTHARAPLLEEEVDVRAPNRV